MKQNNNTTPNQGHSTNMLLYAVAPTPKLSTDAIALEGAVVSRGNGIGATSEVYLMECIVGMKHYPDKYFDLAVVDPPYGLGTKLVDGGAGRNGKFDKNKEAVKWDKLPPIEYFNELFRVSKNQIIWGSNYFALPPTRCNLLWDKIQEFTGSDFELAWTSFDKASKAFRMSRVEAYSNGKIHPCQKPISLYDWIFKNYSEPGQKVIDTHLGSGSSRISAHKYGLNFTGFEIDEEYYQAQEIRFKDYQSQLNLFNNQEKPITGSRYNYYCAERSHGGPVCLKQCNTCANLLP